MRGALPAQEAIRHLDHDAGAVAGVRLAAARPAVQEVDQDLDGLVHDGVRLSALDVHDEADAAGVVLVRGIVQALGGPLAGVQRGRRHTRILFDVTLPVSDCVGLLNSWTILPKRPVLVSKANSYPGH